MIEVDWDEPASRAVSVVCDSCGSSRRYNYANSVRGEDEATDVSWWLAVNEGWTTDKTGKTRCGECST